ncbi:hypothetical protein Q8A64_08010 [Oxalobacteraceae bacterium R-40]|uniref:Uncharacterized protein n=1 Tax=Keguizhuia sedimenti TaxID=3064264 RepID=A0ABU1BPI5_9BURK|nr:hypothetical protein [Oxalobacteraceae bacterium R-40]
MSCRCDTEKLQLSLLQQRSNAATQQRSNAATQQRSNAATQQRSNAATQQRSKKHCVSFLQHINMICRLLDSDHGFDVILKVPNRSAAERKAMSGKASSKKLTSLQSSCIYFTMFLHGKAQYRMVGCRLE